MTREEQLQWERRAGRPAAFAAFGSAVLGAAALAIGTAVQGKRQINDAVDELMSAHSHSGQYLAAVVMQGIAIALMGVALVYLYRVTAYRRPETPPALSYLAVILPVVVGALTILNGIEHLHAADKVVAALHRNPLPPKDAIKFAEHETLHGTAATVGYIGAAVGLGLAFTIGLISINARRAGILSGFMGILGVIVGALLVLGGLLGMPPIVQYFWLVALGLLFLDRWPGQQGRGPAWEAGEAIPWPTAAELRAEQTAQRGLGDGDSKDRGPARRARRAEPVEVEAGDGGGAYDEEAELAGTPHPRSKKRKRKRRR